MGAWQCNSLNAILQFGAFQRCHFHIVCYCFETQIFDDFPYRPLLARSGYGIHIALTGCRSQSDDRKCAFLTVTELPLNPRLQRYICRAEVMAPLAYAMR